QNLKIPESSLTSTSKGLLISASGLSLSGNGHWHYKTHVIFPISDSGSIDLSISGTTLSLTLIFSKDSTGHLKVSATGCKFNIGHLGVHFHGGAS
ncbi:hypothetical protein, partial [Salmonella sp. s51228]|uniref:hypothetical protein n=1 Tax=Salmonella sp. s51228 TaxID=3159652 RepID=UPI003980D924